LRTIVAKIKKLILPRFSLKKHVIQRGFRASLKVRLELEHGGTMKRTVWAGCIVLSAVLLVAAIRTGTSAASGAANTGDTPKTSATPTSASSVNTSPSLKAAAPAAGTFKLSGRVTNSSGKNNLYVALWQADGFLRHPVQQHKIAAGADPLFNFEVPTGRWALSSFEDRNDNGVLDMGMFGPKEPSGFWRPFNGHHKPRFDEVASDIDKDISNIEINLK
jgi:uncharacterized protein (DUF2141 family)